MLRRVGYLIPWAKMLRSETREIHLMKCMTYSFLKGKDVILGPKVNNFQKHVRKTNIV
jgi:hypothetical protein